jgi:uncharacterized protein
MIAVGGAIQVDIPLDSIAAFCRRWHITELALFGSVLRADFRPDSDVDILVTFAPDAHWSLLDMVRMQEEIEAIFERDVDLGERAWVERSENVVRKRAILDSLVPIYAA